MLKLKRLNLLIIITILAVILVIGTVFYHYSEGWSLVDSFYFSTITLTTIGYGDLAPTTDSAKIFTAFYAIFGIGLMLYFVRSVIGLSFFGRDGIIERAILSHQKLDRHATKIEEHGKEIQKLKKEMQKKS
ncbi:two pore domain potassium channel family protein [bacterium]|nr:two pore domain potassium channel family protein [bacterium]